MHTHLAHTIVLSSNQHTTHACWTKETQ
uniref:Uncharacterized protein n=1 Tax=Arundo donax TaxID=35708 RepID=A0A0A8YJ38_ARUDO